MNPFDWKVSVALILALAGRQDFTVPMPRLYQDSNVVVTLRPATDLDLDYIGISLLVRPR